MLALMLAVSGSIVRVSVPNGGGVANGASSGAVISADGRYVAFTSYASNLVGRGDQNGAADVYLHDMGTGLNECLTCPTGGRLAGMSSNARYVGLNRGSSGFFVDRLTHTETAMSGPLTQVSSGWASASTSFWTAYVQSVRSGKERAVGGDVNLYEWAWVIVVNEEATC